MERWARELTGWTKRAATPQRVAQLFVVLVCTALLALTAWRVDLARTLALHNTQVQARNIARSLAQHAQATIGAADLVVFGLVERLDHDGSEAASLERLRALAQRHVNELPSLAALLVVGPDGAVRVNSRTGAPPVANIADRAFFAHHRIDPNRSAFIGPLIQNYFDGRWSITVSRRVDQPDGSFGGVVVAIMDVAFTFRDYYATFDLGPNGLVLLTDDQGLSLARYPQIDRIVGQSVAAMPIFQEYRRQGAVGDSVGASPVDGVERLRSFRKVEGYPLVMFVALGVDDALAGWRRDAWIAFLAAFAVAAVVGGFGWRLARDIKLRHDAELAVRQSERQYRLLADNSNDLIVQLDQDFRRVYVSPSFRALLGYEPSELIGRSTADLANPEDRPALLDNFEQLKMVGHAPPVTYRIRHKDGSEIWVELIGRRLSETNGYVITVRDVERRKQAEDLLHEANNQLQQIAMQDGLTGIANRRCFDMALQREFRRAARGELPIALLMLDVDHFKNFNDAYGHPAGDACLRAIAEAVSGQMRRPGDLASRYGGEEFVALLPDTDEVGARAMAERIRLAVRALAISHQGNGPGIATISVGVGVLRPHPAADAPHDLVALADQALYRAKSSGRDRVWPDFTPAGLEEKPAANIAA